MSAIRILGFTLLIALVVCFGTVSARADSVTYDVYGASIAYQYGLIGSGLNYNFTDGFGYKATSSDFSYTRTDIIENGVEYITEDWNGTITGGTIELTRTFCNVDCQTLTATGELISGSVVGHSEWESDSLHPIIWTIANAGAQVTWQDGGVSHVFFGLTADYAATTGSITFTPEPGTLLLVGSGALAIAGVLRRRLKIKRKGLRMKQPWHTLLVLLVGFGLSLAARAGTINVVDSLHLATGMDCSGNVIASGGQADCHWTVVDYFGSGPAYTVVPNVSGACPAGHCGWVPNDQQGDWVAFDPNNPSHNGTGTYSRTFDLTGQNLAEVYLQGWWALDDVGSLALNGNQIASLQANDNWSSLHPFFLPAGSPFFGQGLNTLTITITSSDFFIEGVRLESGSVATTPEPASLLLMATGTLALSAALRRKLFGLTKD